MQGQGYGVGLEGAQGGEGGSGVGGAVAGWRERC